MHNLLHENASAAPRLPNRAGFAAMAAILLALGVGATTAVFTLVDRALPHAAPSVTCETMMLYSSDHSAAMAAGIPASAEISDRVANAYETSFEAADDAIGSLPDIAQSLSHPIVLSLLGAGTLALLVACTRAAAALAEPSRIAALATGTTLGALAVATLSLRLLALPAIGARAAAFAACISLLAVYFVRTARRKSALTGG